MFPSQLCLRRCVSHGGCRVQRGWVDTITPSLSQQSYRALPTPAALQTAVQNHVCLLCLLVLPRISFTGVGAWATTAPGPIQVSSATVTWAVGSQQVSQLPWDSLSSGNPPAPCAGALGCGLCQHQCCWPQQLRASVGCTTCKSPTIAPGPAQVSLATVTGAAGSWWVSPLLLDRFQGNKNQDGDQVVRKKYCQEGSGDYSRWVNDAKQFQKWQLSWDVLTGNITAKMRNVVTSLCSTQWTKPTSWSAVPIAGHHRLKTNSMKTGQEVIKND